MSDEQITETEQLDNSTETDETQVSTDSTDWKAEARKWEKRAKDSQSFREAAEKWNDYERSQKPEQERMFEELATARAEAEASKVALLRYEVAAEKNIPADAIKLLSGSSREDLEEAADSLLALIANQSKPKTPKPDMSQGKPANGSTTTADQFASALGDLL